MSDTFSTLRDELATEISRASNAAYHLARWAQHVDRATFYANLPGDGKCYAEELKLAREHRHGYLGAIK